jgi:bifunctional pyridoxal-dependent enzyme with beta-cystathionase and maltose regulon repressor activities
MTTTAATDFDIARLRARRTNKWHKFPPDVLPAWVADMDFGVAPSITAALARLTQDQEYGYAARDGVLAAAFDCRALELPCPAGQFFLEQARVGLNFGETFGADYAGFARLNFATPAAILREIVTRMGESVRSR